MQLHSEGMKARRFSMSESWPVTQWQWCPEVYRLSSLDRGSLLGLHKVSPPNVREIFEFFWTLFHLCLQLRHKSDVGVQRPESRESRESREESEEQELDQVSRSLQELDQVSRSLQELDQVSCHVLDGLALGLFVSLNTLKSLCSTPCNST